MEEKQGMKRGRARKGEQVGRGREWESEVGRVSSSLSRYSSWVPRALRGSLRALVSPGGKLDTKDLCNILLVQSFI
jgi:hypothetical protein